MEKYKEYISVSNWLGAFVLIMASTMLVELETVVIVFIAIVQFVVAVMQLLAGIHFVANWKKRADWFDKYIRYYWWITIGYFMVLYIFYTSTMISEELFFVWLLIVPWAIAIYQYVLVRKLMAHLMEQQQLRLGASKKI